MNSNSPPEITPELLQENPALALCLTLFSLFVFAGLFGVIMSWIFVGISLWKKRTLLPIEPWTPRPWGLVDILLTGILLVITQILLTAIAIPLLGIDVEALRADEASTKLDVPMPLAAVVSAGYLLTVGLITFWIVLRFQTRTEELGWSIGRLPQKLLIGLIAGLATLPFIFALSAAVTLTTNAEYDHPILDAMKAEGSLNSYFLALFSAVIVAPIAEEFLFRVLIQGWLQSIPFVSPMSALLGRTDAGVSTGQVVFEAAAVDAQRFTSDTLPADDNPTHTESKNPYSPGPFTPDPNASSTPILPPIWPSVVTGILFGLAHWGYGLSFVPLIALGIFLGLLYRATKSIWPCVMVHFMLNASSMIALGVGVFIEKVAGS